MTIPQTAREIGTSIDMLATRVIEGVWDRLPGYDVNHMRREDLEKFVVANLSLALAAVETGRPLTTAEKRWAVEIGKSRALQGVPPEAVMQSWRRAERTVFEVFLETGDLSAAELRICSQSLGRAFDSLVEASSASYRRTQDEITTHFEQVAADLVVRLAGGERVDREEVADQARLVGAEPDESYQALTLGLPVGASPPAIGHVQRHVLTALSPVTRGRILAGSPGGRVVLLVPRPQGAPDPASILKRALKRPELWEDAIAGVGEAGASLADVGTSCAQALSALEVGQLLGCKREVVAYIDVIPEVLIAHNKDLAALLVTSRLGPLLKHSYLVETLRAFLRCGLSVTRTAKELVVHPNTVSYRLDRIRELTGREVCDILRETDLIMAMHAYDLLAPQRADTPPYEDDPKQG